MITPYHFLVALLVSASALAGNPLVLKMEGFYLEEGDGPRTVQDWAQTIQGQPGETLVAHEAKRKVCSGGDCLTEEFRTTVTPERLAGDLIQAKVVFVRKAGPDSTRIEGTVFARPNEQGQFSVDTTQDTRQRFVLKMTPLDPKR